MNFKRFMNARSILILLMLVSVGILLLGNESILYLDDWSQIVRPAVFDRMGWVDWSDRRPLLQIPTMWILSLFGLNLNAFSLVLVGLNVLSALLLGGLMYRVLPEEQRHLGLIAGALSLVYPAVYARTYLTMIAPLTSWLFVLLFAYFLLEFAVRRITILLLVALSFLALSLGIYEAGLGIAMMWSIFIAVRYSKRGTRRDRLFLLLPMVIGIGFAVWRTFGYSRIGIQDNYLESLAYSPIVILQRLLLGVQVMIWSWTEPVRQSLSLQKNWIVMVLLLIIISGSMALVSMGCRRVVHCNSAIIPNKSKEARQLVVIFLIGAIFLAAGYLPSIALFQPNLSSTSSRFNLFAIPGAALCIVSALALVATLLACCRKCKKALLYVGVIPLFFLGWFTQIEIQKDISLAWQEQKHIWLSVLDLAPNFTEDTAVYFVLPGYLERGGHANWRRTPLTASWEVSAALQVLYNNRRLSGDVIFPDMEISYGALAFSRSGIENFWSGQIIPYDQAIFLIYTGNPRKLDVLTDVSDYFSLSNEIPDYSPYSRIITDDQPISPWRSLVNGIP